MPFIWAYFNIMIMASVCLAAIKIGGVMLGMSPLETVLIASIITVIYSSMGIKGVIITDFFQFILAMRDHLGSVLLIDHPQSGSDNH